MMHHHKSLLIGLLWACACSWAEAKKGGGGDAMGSSAKGKKGKGDDECEERGIVETGYEVWQRQGINSDVDMKIESRITKEDCSYEISMSFNGHKLSDLGVPFMNNVSGPILEDSHPPGTGPNFFTSDGEGYTQTCKDDGLFEADPFPGFLPSNVGENEFYTDFGWTMAIPKKTQKATGFKEITIGASPCGTFLQPFPHYSFHIYNVDTDFRKKMLCNSKGGYFCKNITQQCSDAGRKFQMDGVGIPRCEDGPNAGQYTNVPALTPNNFLWTIDGGAAGINAATPAMGLHGVNPAEFAPQRELYLPYYLLVQYDSTVIGNHVVTWSGFAIGESPENMYEMNANYTCRTDKKSKTLPTRSALHYNPDTKLTTVTINGPANKCKKDFTETTEPTMGKKGKKSKSELFVP